MRHRLTALLAGTAVLVLTGCGTPGIADAVRPGAPSGWEGDPTGDGPVAGWIDEGTRFAVVTLGSSSCPIVVTALTVQADDRLSLTFASSPNDPCTADLARTTHEFDLPGGITGRPVTITVSYEDGHGTDTLSLE